MNLFIAGWRSAGGIDTDAPESALARLLEQLPFFPGRPVESWSSADGRFTAAWVCHDAGVRYACEREGSFALFSGRPFRWTGELEADGRSPADAAFFLDPATAWAGAIDGRFAAVAYHAGAAVVEIATDPVGAYPVHEAEGAGAHWFSNSAAALRELTGAATLRLESIAGLVGGGWPLDGDPMWEGLRRVEPGTVARLARDGETRAALLTAAERAGLPGRGLEPNGAAARLTAAARALADWPRRPNVVPVTGGRDSRVVLGAALAAQVDFETLTGGAPEDPDVRAGGELARVAGVSHSLIPGDPHGNMWSDHRGAARLVRLTAGGTASLADAAGFPHGPRGGPLPLWHSGQGGEVGRAYYGSGEGLAADGLTRRLYDAFTARRPHRRELLSEAGRALVERGIRAWVDAELAAGVDARDVPDMFYVSRRMATWAAPTHGCVEYVRDTTSPLWSRRVLPDLLAPPQRERAAAAYHRAVLPLLAADLTRVPLGAGRAWDSSPGRLARAGSLARKAAREALRRAQETGLTPFARRRDAAGRPGHDPFAPILADVREQVLAHERHAAWEVLDRARCEALLTRPAASLDEMSRYQVWRLATLFVE